MVERLRKGDVPVQVWNRSPLRPQTLSACGATILSKGAESTAPVMFSMLANDEALDALIDAADGPLTSATPPSVWVDCSTVSVQVSLRAAAAARAVGTAFVCAPVSGNPHVVRAGKLTLVVSGQPEAVRRVQPLLDLDRPVHSPRGHRAPGAGGQAVHQRRARLADQRAGRGAGRRREGRGQPPRPDAVHQRQRDGVAVHPDEDGRVRRPRPRPHLPARGPAQGRPADARHRGRPPGRDADRVGRRAGADPADSAPASAGSSTSPRCCCRRPATPTSKSSPSSLNPSSLNPSSLIK